MKISVLPTSSAMMATLQDLGRLASVVYGVPQGGAMDALSLRLSNCLCGNEEGAACIEYAGGIMKLRILAKGLVAIYGAGAQVRISGQTAPTGRVYALNVGDQLELFPSPRGNFAYIATPGGWKVPLVLGSRSTYTAGGFGGWQGRLLAPHDELDSAMPSMPLPPVRIGSFYPSWPTPERHDEPPPIRILPGPEWSFFSEHARQLLLQTGAYLSPQRSRQALRLEGCDFLQHQHRGFLSACVCPGLIQVPPDGRAAILMADAQSTGGFPRLAQVIRADWSRLAQYPNGQKIRLAPCSITEAQDAWREQENRFAHIRMAIRMKWNEINKI